MLPRRLITPSTKSGVRGMGDLLHSDYGVHGTDVNSVVYIGQLEYYQLH